MTKLERAAIRNVHLQGFREPDERKEPFGMPFTNRELAVIVADDLNRHDPGMWFYKVERHLDDKRWIIVREDRDFHFGVSMRAPQTEARGA